MSNSIDPDATVLYEPSHLDLRCLQKPIIIACGSVRVNMTWDMTTENVTAQPANNIKMTSYQRRCDVITSHRR